jgi:hypothetical protein
VDAHTFTKQAENFKHTLSPCQKADGNGILGQDRQAVLMVEFMQQGTTIISEVYCETKENSELLGFWTLSIVRSSKN